MNYRIALDGPSGAGKSTVAKAVAKKLGIVYVDTGALYRTLALYAIRNNVACDKEGEVLPILSGADIQLKYIDGTQCVLLNGEDVSALIRTPEISMGASDISAIPKVREYLLDLQRKIAYENSVIMDGRDIGTVILPDAEVKIFITASPEIRAKRRYNELIEKGQDVVYEDVLKDVIQRDYNDSHRDVAPLKQAEDAVLLDTSYLDLDESINETIKIIKDKLNLEVE